MCSCRIEKERECAAQTSAAPLATDSSALRERPGVSPVASATAARRDGVLEHPPTISTEWRVRPEARTASAHAARTRA